MVQSDVKRFGICGYTIYYKHYCGNKLFESSLLQKFTKRVGHLCHVPHLSKSYLVQKYGGRYFAKVKRIDILSRSMEVNVLQK